MWCLRHRGSHVSTCNTMQDIATKIIIILFILIVYFILNNIYLLLNSVIIC